MQRWRELMLLTMVYHDDEPGDDAYAYTERRMHHARQGLTTYEFTALHQGASSEWEPYSLVANIAEDDPEFYQHYLADCDRIAAQFFKAGETRTLSVLTVWSCEAGFSYVPGEPHEYEDDAQLIGYLHPQTFAFVALDEIQL